MSDPSSMRVMMTVDTVGGVWTYATSLIRPLSAAGCEIELVTIGPRPTLTQRRVLEGVRGVSVSETDLLLEWADPAETDAEHARRELADIAERFKPDLMHFNSFREATFGWPMPVLVVAHSCVNSWADACDARSAFGGAEWRRYSDVVAAALNRADVWVAPSFAFRERVRELYRPSSAGHVIWNGVQKGMPPRRGKRPFVLGAGRVWDVAKNLGALASIAPDLVWPVEIAGAAQSSPGEEVNLTAGAIWLGELTHASLLCEMQEAAVFCSPALYEPFGLSVLEAAAAGCALVLSDIPTFRELWQDAALFVDPRDANALQRGISALCSDDVLRTRLQHAAHERSLRYALARTGGRYLELYVRLTGLGRDDAAALALEVPV